MEDNEPNLIRLTSDYALGILEIIGAIFTLVIKPCRLTLVASVVTVNHLIYYWLRDQAKIESEVFVNVGSALNQAAQSQDGLLVPAGGAGVQLAS
jgi:hypothetical protein